MPVGARMPAGSIVVWRVPELPLHLLLFLTSGAASVIEFWPILYYTILYYTILYYFILYYVVYSILYYIIPGTMLFFTRYCTLL